jgi:hypothetical protein
MNDHAREDQAKGNSPMDLLRDLFKRPVFQWSVPIFVIGIFMCAFLSVSVVGLGLWLGGSSNPQVAKLMDIAGDVQVSSVDSSGLWMAAENGDQVRTRQRIKTAAGSTATLVFHDGSRTTLGSHSDVTLTLVDGERWGGLQVVLTQNAGKTNHSVVPQKKESNIFDVFTPSGVASVHGTNFDVTVNPRGYSRFAVNTGRILVANDETELFLNSGQATAAQPGQDFDEPSYQFKLQGELDAIWGDVWLVSDVPITVLPETFVTGEVEEGQMINVEGRVLDSGEWLADSIEPMDEGEQHIIFMGVVQSEDGDNWQIGNWNLVINNETVIGPGINVGSTVKILIQILEDGHWLALSIEPVDSGDEEWTATPEATPDSQAQPSLSFVDDELEAKLCAVESPDKFSFTGTLLNTGSPPDDYASGVVLAYQVIKGAEYVDSVILSASSWDRIDAGEQVEFEIRLDFNDAAWQAAQDESEIKVRVFIASEINRPDHLPARLTATVISDCDDEPEPEMTDTPQPTLDAATATLEAPPDLTPTPTVSPGATTCTGADPHPTGMKLAQRYGVTYEEIMSWFCQGFGFGEIDLAYSLSLESGVPVEQIFAMRRSGMGWGEIKQQLAPKPPKDKGDKPPNNNKPPKDDKDKPPGKDKDK